MAECATINWLGDRLLRCLIGSYHNTFVVRAPPVHTEGSQGQRMQAVIMRPEEKSGLRSCPMRREDDDYLTWLEARLKCVQGKVGIQIYVSTS